MPCCVVLTNEIFCVKIPPSQRSIYPNHNNTAFTNAIDVHKKHIPVIFCISSLHGNNASYRNTFNFEKSSSKDEMGHIIPKANKLFISV